VLGDAALLVQRYYDALNRHEFSALEPLLAPDLLHHAEPCPIDRQALIRRLIDHHAGFPDLAHTVEDIIAEPERVAVRTRTTGTHLGLFLGHPPSGRRFAVSAMSWYRLSGGVICEIWDAFDALAMLQQLGLYQPVVGGTPLHDGTPLSGSSRPGSGRRPPGPSREISLAEVRRDPLQFLRGLTEEFGDFVRYVCGGRETVLLNRPDAARRVLHEHAANYTKLGTPDLLLLKPMLGDGLLTTEGSIWKEDRQWFQPAFTRRKVEQQAEAMVHVTRDMLARWMARTDPDAPVDMVRELSRLTLEIAARVMFSTDWAGDSAAFGEAMDVLNETMGHPRPDAPDVQAQFQPALALIRRTAWQAILSRKFYDSGEDDVIELLLRAQRERGDSDRRLVDQAVTLILAGHETTGKALSWALALVDAHPDVRRCLHAELDEQLGDRAPQVEDLPRLYYTRAVVDEALRLDPPIWLVTRTAMQEDTIAGYTIPAGALVALSPYLLHRHPDLWAEPDRFVPARFLPGSRTPGAGSHQACQFLPFSHGPRLCLGKSFATVEMPLVLASVCSAFVASSLPGHTVEPEALVTLRPRNGLPMRLTPRRPPAAPSGNEERAR